MVECHSNVWLVQVEGFGSLLDNLELSHTDEGACAPGRLGKHWRANRLSIGFCNLLWVGRLSLTDESACALMRLPTSWNPLACSQWLCWWWAWVKKWHQCCTFVYGGFVGSDERSVPLSANVSPPFSFRNPCRRFGGDKSSDDSYLRGLGRDTCALYYDFLTYRLYGVRLEWSEWIPWAPPHNTP